MKLFILPAANEDRFEALSWLMERGWYRAAGLLWNAWDEALDEIAASPRRFPPVESAPTGMEVREYFLLKLGYRVVFEVRSTEVRIVSFGRFRRHDRLWMDRLEPGTTD